MSGVVLPGLDGSGHRLQRDWNKESAKHMGRAASTVNYSDKQRNFSLQKITHAAKVTNESDFRVRTGYSRSLLLRASCKALRVPDRLRTRVAARK
eukprot:1184920-Prorocentrum_minimum.AAC.1